MSEAVAAEVPLVELLESVPEHCREMIEIEPCHHRNIPYGRYCQEAAKKIRRLDVDRTKRREEVERVIAYLQSGHGTSNHDMSCDGCKMIVELKDFIVAMKGEPK